MDSEALVEKKNRWSKPLGIGVIFVTLIACVLGVAYSKTDLGQAAKDAEKNRAAAEKLGLIFDSAHAAELYAVPEAENGASLVKSVLNIPKDNGWESTKGPISEIAVNKKRAVFESAVKTLEEASTRKHLIFKRNLTDPAAIIYPEYSQIKSWEKLLCQMAHFALERGDAGNAKRYLDVAAYLASATDDEGILIATLVRVAGAAIVETELKKILAMRGREAAWQDVVEYALQRLDKPYDVKRSLMLEHWFAVAGTEAVMKDPSGFYSAMGSTGMPPALRAAKFIPRFKEANLSRINEAYVAATSALPADPYDFVATKAALARLDEMSSTQNLSYTMLSLVAPVFGEFSAALSRETAYRNALTQALTLLKTGQDPANGLPLKDRRRRDLDNKDLRVKKVNGGWVVYSVGYNQTDEGGLELTDQKGDWVIKLPK